MIWATIAGATYLIGPPLLHALHDQTAAAGISAALRLGLPLAGLLLGTALWAGVWGGCTACQYVIPVIVGGAVLTPIALDAVILSRHEAPRVASGEPILFPVASRRAAGLALAWRF